MNGFIILLALQFELCRESMLSSASPRTDLIFTFRSSKNCDVTEILLFIEQRIAFTPYTTKCSPKRMTFPGADAFDFMRKLSTHILPLSSFRLLCRHSWHIFPRYLCLLQVLCKLLW